MLTDEELQETLAELRRRKSLFTDAIAAIERLRGGEGPKKRGRKEVGPAERAEIAERMRARWAKRRDALPRTVGAGMGAGK